MIKTIAKLTAGDNPIDSASKPPRTSTRTDLIATAVDVTAPAIARAASLEKSGYLGIAVDIAPRCVEQAKAWVPVEDPGCFIRIGELGQVQGPIKPAFLVDWFDRTDEAVKRADDMWVKRGTQWAPLMQKMRELRLAAAKDPMGPCNVADPQPVEGWLKSISLLVY